jgi:regulatory protein
VKAQRAPSLKAKALQWLAQREQSRKELRRKLMRYSSRARAEHRSDGRSTADAAPDVPRPEADPKAADAVSVSTEVEAVLDWLEDHRYLSRERFVESRVNARASRFGNLRIRRELAEHGVVLDREAEKVLASTELERARLVYARKFRDAPASSSETARRIRFLGSRGFSPDVIRQLMKEAARLDPALV